MAGAIYTKTGDKGETSLYDGTRVSKDDVRVEAYGTVDELGAWLGLATNYIEDKDLIDEIRHIQNRLFVVNEHLATSDKSKIKHFITEEDIKNLEDLVDKYMEIGGRFQGFIVNGTSKSAGVFHLARTVCRRAERRIITLTKAEEVDPLVVKYINRLADTIYAFAMANEAEAIKVVWE